MANKKQKDVESKSYSEIVNILHPKPEKPKENSKQTKTAVIYVNPAEHEFRLNDEATHPLKEYLITQMNKDDEAILLIMRGTGEQHIHFYKLDDITPDTLRYLDPDTFKKRFNNSPVFTLSLKNLIDTDPNNKLIQYFENKKNKNKHEENFLKALKIKHENLNKILIKNEREKNKKLTDAKEKKLVKDFIEAYKKNCWFGTGWLWSLFGRCLPRSTLGQQVFNKPNSITVDNIRIHATKKTLERHVNAASVKACNAIGFFRRLSSISPTNQPKTLPSSMDRRHST